MGSSKSREDDLRRLPGVDEFVGGSLAVEAQLARHFVEGVGELTEFVVRRNGQHLVEVALAKITGGLRQVLDGPQDGSAEPVRKEQSQRECRRNGQEHDASGLTSRFAGAKVFL